MYNYYMTADNYNISALELEQLVKKYLSYRGRLGGLKKNPRKGFGSGDNARKAALARWRKK